MSSSLKSAPKVPAKDMAVEADAPSREGHLDDGSVARFIRVVNRLSLVCGVLAATAIAVSVLLVCQLVFVRYVLNASTVWQTEAVIYLMIGATLFGTPYVQSVRGHVNVDLLPLYLGRKARYGLYYLCLVLGMAVSLIIGAYGFMLTVEAFEFDWRSPSVWGARLWLPYASIPVGFLLLFLQFVADFLAAATGRDAPFGIQDEEDATARALRKEH